jgi:hypothetical protein
MCHTYLMSLLRHVSVITYREFRFAAHGYGCVTLNKSLVIYLTLLHCYQFPVLYRNVSRFYWRLLK